MADLTGGELVARVLAREGVGAIFTLCGGEGETIEDPRRLRPALERALASGRVTCLNVILDPDAYRGEGGGSMAI
jgi:thiamine pyrophosphate-dependent acetolactate synthase large subunit-like protein